VAISRQAGPADIATPGHVFPLRARDGGVLVRAGHTEAAVDISRLAGLNPSGVICEIMKEDGTMARLPDLVEFAREHGLKIGTISDLIAYRHKHDNLLQERDDRQVSSAYGGDWRMRIFSDQITGTDHVVLSKGDITTPEPVLVRTHAINALEDILGLGPSPADELPNAMRLIAEEGRGAVILFRDPYPKLRLAADEDEGPRTVKNTGLGAQILSTLGISQLVLLTDNPETRYLGLDAYHIEIVGTRPITPAAHATE
jgi:3,4-dihydroxy 2-butanone 4-phosphate synthase/GTP cyclohydrolase II